MRFALAAGGTGTRSAAATLVGGKDSDFTGGATIDGFFATETTLDNASSERLRVTSAGNVGIGTTGPDSTLHVSGGYIHIPTTTALPPAADCDVAAEIGRMIVVYDQAATQHLAICSKTSAGPIQWQYK